MVKSVPYLRPPFGANERYAAYRVMTGAEVSTGKKIHEFEKEFVKYIKCDSAQTVCNGTVALDLIWRTYLHTGELRRGDHVLCPSFTFVAVPNSIINAGLVPVFCDIDPDTWNIDVSKCPDNDRIRAVVAVHTFGNPCDMEAIDMWCDMNDLLLIEDCAEACGAIYRGKKVGSFGDASAFSFNATKNLTTGEGGMVCFNDNSNEDCVPDYESVARAIKGHGYGDGMPRNASIPGYNWRMDNIHAAIGLEQLKTLDIRNQKRAQKKYFIQASLAEKGICPEYQVRTRGSMHVNQIFGMCVNNRDEMYTYLCQCGIEAKKYFSPPCHMQEFYYRHYVHPDFPATEYVSDHILCLPFDDKLSDEEMEYMVDKICEVT